MKAYSDFINEQLTKTLDETEVVEVVEDHLMKDAKKALPAFLKDLEKLTQKHGIFVETKTGLSYELPSLITDVKYYGDVKKGKVAVIIKVVPEELIPSDFRR